MARRYYNLPPLTTLAAFEAAARHLSFKDAAQELSVTPGAVSHQIKALEGELGATLFRRMHRGVVLTEEGETLFNTLSSSFMRISNVLQTVREARSRNVATIGSTSAVSNLYLSRAMIRFWREYPDIQVNQVVQDYAQTGVQEWDIFLRYGRDADDRLTHTKLYTDNLVPVGDEATAALLKGGDLEKLAQQRLIYLESSDKSWTTWAEWFRGLGYTGPITTGLRVNNYAVALQAAREGAGIALGWQRLLLPLFRAGKLAQIEPHKLGAPHSFYLVNRPSEDLSEAAKLLRNWILREITNTSHELNSR